MTTTIDLTLTDSDFGIEELPEGNALGCAFCGACASCPSCAASASCPSCAASASTTSCGRRGTASPPAAHPDTTHRPEGALTR